MVKFIVQMSYGLKVQCIEKQKICGEVLKSEFQFYLKASTVYLEEMLESSQREALSRRISQVQKKITPFGLEEES